MCTFSYDSLDDTYNWSNSRDDVLDDPSYDVLYDSSNEVASYDISFQRISHMILHLIFWRIL